MSINFDIGSNLLMEVVVLGIFGTVFVFHNEDLANRGLEIVVLVALLSSLLTLTIITVIKGIQDMKGIDYRAEAERNRDLSSSAHSDRKIPDLKLDQEKGLHNYNKNKVVPQNSIGIAEETKSPISTSLPPLQAPIPPEANSALKNPKNEISSLHKDIFQKADSHPSKLPKLAFKTGENLPFEVHAERIKAFDSTMMESKKPNFHISESEEDLDSPPSNKEANSSSPSSEKSKSSSEPPSSPEGKPFSQMERQLTTGNLRGEEVESKNREKDMTLDNLNGGSRIEERDVSAIFKK